MSETLSMIPIGPCVADSVSTECRHAACALYRKRAAEEAVEKTVTDVDVFGKWVESMWFSGESREMGERDIAIMGLGIGGEMAEVLEKAVIAAGKVQELIKKEIRDHSPARE